MGINVTIDVEYCLLTSYSDSVAPADNETVAAVELSNTRSCQLSTLKLLDVPHRHTRRADLKVSVRLQHRTVMFNRMKT